MSDKYTAEKITSHNFNENSLDGYVRTQEVHNVYRLIDGEYKLIEQPYTEEWSLEKKRDVAKDLLSDEFISYGIFVDGTVVGFIGMCRELDGKRMILDVIQVTRDMRGKGLGRILFNKAKEICKEHGAEEMYFSACTSEQTIAFYYAMGARLTDNPIARIAADEPFDMQLVCSIE